MKTLRDIEIGEKAVIKKIHGSGALKRRFMDMGITRGTEVYFRKESPLGDPIEINVLGYELAIRKSDAELIEVEEK